MLAPIPEDERYMTYATAARDAQADQVGICMTTVSAVTGGIGKYYAEKAEAMIILRSAMYWPVGML